jgi:hypothetical protein
MLAVLRQIYVFDRLPLNSKQMRHFASNYILDHPYNVIDPVTYADEHRKSVLEKSQEHAPGCYGKIPP